jgi:NAD(P)H-dependent flavin oxidoreductase YrpB (nitropropane dioxygenase family)
MLEIEYPVMAFNHCRDVVVAVSNAGGCGVLGALGFSPDQIKFEANWMRERTDQSFGIDLVFPATAPEAITREQLLAMIPQGYRDFMDRFKADLGLPEQIWGGAAVDFFLEHGIGGSYESEMTQLDAVLETRPKVVATALGFNREIVERVHSAGAIMMSLVGNVKNARRAAEAGVDVIVAQGTEAGGHTGRIGTLALVPQVVDAVAPTPVLAAGGICDGRGLVAALALGAIGVWTGTIWLSTHESPLVDWVKERVLDATDEDAVITKIYTGKTVRALKNKYMERWQQPDAPQLLPMPLQNFYSPMPLFLSTEDMHSASLFDKPGLREYATTPAGNAVGLVEQRKSVRKTMEDMITEAMDILGD